MSASQSVIAAALLASLASPPVVIGDDARPVSEKFAAGQLPAHVEYVKQDRKIPGSPVVEMQVQSMFSGPRNFRDEDVGLLRQFRHLRRLRLRARLTDAGIAELSELRSLTSLELEQCEFTDEGLAKLAALDKLTALRLFLCKNVTGDGFAALTQVKELRVDGCRDITHLRIAPLKELTHLGMCDCDGLQASGLDEIRGLPVLSRLKLTHCRQIAGSELEVVTGLHNLRHLVLRFHHEQADATFTNIRDLGALETLALGGKLKPVPGLAELGPLRNLRSLDVAGDLVTEEAIGVLKGLPNLAELRLFGDVTIGDEVLSLGELSHLTTIEFQKCRNLRDDLLAAVKECTNLKRLVLDGHGNLTVAGMEQLRHLPKLNTLVLEGHFSLEALRSIKQLTSLRTLQIDLPSKAGIDEFRTALPATEITWRNRQKFGPGPWSLEAGPRNGSHRLPHGYPIPYERTFGEGP